MKFRDIDSLENGRIQAHPPPGDEIVISGISSLLPDSDDVLEFADKLYNKADLIVDHRPWLLDHPEIPKRTGKVRHIEKFDPGYFGVHYKLAHILDPACRVLLEKTAEAFMDAGYNPQSLYGERIGVFLGGGFSAIEREWHCDRLEGNGTGLMGSCRAVHANRIAYSFGLKGPAYTLDTACSSGLSAFDHAYRAIRGGRCDAAIVGAANVCLHPYVSLQFSRLGVLSNDGKCKVFDESGNGYCRSEGILVFFLQKKKDSRRIYSTVIHSKSNCDGYKEKGITFPSGEIQQELLEHFYEECQINPATVGWVEAHGTGTKAGDPEEAAAIANVFCPNRKGPLKIGSLKSNAGHTEVSSGLTSIVKVIISMENGLIPPNIHFKSPRKEIQALHDGRLEVITETTPWEVGYAGVNSFGFGGSNVHTLLKCNEKLKVNKGLPDDDLPRLISVSGRTHEAIESLLSNLENNGLDAELVRLYQAIFKDVIPSYYYRGYTLLSKSGKLDRDISQMKTVQPKFWYFFPGLGFQWRKELQALMKLSLFSQAVVECNDILKRHNVDILSLLSEKIGKEMNETFVTILMNCMVQIVLVNVLQKLGLTQPTGILGTSYGEIVCAYADGALTLEQALLTTFYVAKAVSQLESQKGSIVLIGLPYDQVKKMAPNGLTYVCQGKNSTVVSGPQTAVTTLTDKVNKNSSVLIKTLNSVALHSNQIAPVMPALRQQLQKVITEKKKSTSKWFSTCVKDNSGMTQFPVTADYFCQMLVNPISIEDKLKRMKEEEAVVIEFAPCHAAALFLDTTNTVPFLQTLEDNKKDTVTSYLTFIGKLCNSGANLDLALLYPHVEFPVSRTTRMISPFIRWNHNDDWEVNTYKPQDRVTANERLFNVSLKDDEYSFVEGHVVDGRILFPATGYLYVAWESLALMMEKTCLEIPVVFENVKFHRATNIPKDGGAVDFSVTIQRSSGLFEIQERNAAVVTGRIYTTQNIKKEMSNVKHDTSIKPTDQQFVVKSTDIYKELRLRGYNYKELFKSVQCCNMEGSKGFIQWHNNWVSYMDNMLQIQIVDLDSRGLFVPTMIKRVVIDPKKHMEFVASVERQGNGIKTLPVYNYKYAKLICSGGIELRDMTASAINRKKPMGEPVLESHGFHPYDIRDSKKLDHDSIVRMFVHIALENVPTNVIKAAELGEIGNYDNYLCPSVAKCLADLPLMQPDLTIFNPNKDKLEEDIPKEVNIAQDRKMVQDQSSLIAIGCDLLNPNNEKNLQACINSVKEGGFIISREQREYGVLLKNVIKCASVQSDTLLYTLLHKVKAVEKKTTAISVTNDNFSWIKPLQQLLKDDEYQKVIIYSQNQPMTGILGLVNCILREGYTDKARCFFIVDPKVPPFSLENPFYAKQIEKDVAVNIYKDGTWGSYRHTLVSPDKDKIMSPQSYASFATKGDLSSVVWSEGHLSRPILRNEKPKSLYVYYSALNFRDVMTATGRLANELVESDRLFQDVVQGLEFSGRDETGKRVMGTVCNKGITTLVDALDSMVWEVPDGWSLEEAATVPIVYITIIHGFNLAGYPKKGDSVLIHAGTGGIGQACIHYCLHRGCKVYTTVGTQEKREFIKKTFPQIKDNEIGNSRDTSFEQLIMTETNGRGVDFVINSLSEEKLLASVKCLAHGGRFIELGKFDMSNDTAIGMEFMKRNASFIGVMLTMRVLSSKESQMRLWHKFGEGLKDGSVKPFSRVIFDKDQVEDAFRFMAGGKHIGKVLIKIREEEPKKICIPQMLEVESKPRHYCNLKKSYIILGGLGGFGLELADWLILRRAKKIVLSSRTGVRNGYQALRIRTWKSYGVDVVVATDDVTTHEGCLSLLKKANALGPVGGIYNSAVILRDAIFDNQNEEEFTTSFGPKATATIHLDKISREMCPSLDQFVVFSSVSCGRGNTGQTNYGMSNSVMERICEKRVEDGLPGLAIQWGAVGDVGLVAVKMEENTEIVIGGTIPQKIDSCLEVMDTFLNGNDIVVSSMVVAEKQAGGLVAGNIVDTVANIIGVRDLKTVSLHSSLAELGMDSMMAVEIKQTLEREFELFLTPQDIRGMTFSKLQEISASREHNSEDQEHSIDEARRENLILRLLGDEENMTKPLVKLASLQNKNGIEVITPDVYNKVFFLPGIEGAASVFDSLASTLDYEVICVQNTITLEETPIKDMALSCYQNIKPYISKDAVVRLVGYSYGGLIAMELVQLLEGMGHKVVLCMIDSSPEALKAIVNLTYGLDDPEDEALQVRVLVASVGDLYPEFRTQLEESIGQVKTLDERIESIIKLTKGMTLLSDNHKRIFIKSIYNRTISILKYRPNLMLQCPVRLIRPVISVLIDFDEDNCLSKYFKREVDMHTVDGDHLSMLDNVRTAELIAEAFSKPL